MRLRREDPNGPRWSLHRCSHVFARLLAVAAMTTLTAALLNVPSGEAVAGDITTVAGSVVTSATATTIDQNPLAVAASGTAVFVADSAYHVIRRVDTTSGTEVVVAGTGAQGYDGDGGPATAARIGDATDLAVDASGNLYITDPVHSVVRRVDTAGTITTVAGTGTAGFNGDGLAPTATQLRNPNGVALDGADLIIADTGNQRVRRVSAGAVTTIAGTGTAGFNGDGAATASNLNAPVAVVADAAGDVFVSDVYNARLRKVSAGTLATVAGTGNWGFNGDGTATGADLNWPGGLSVDGAGGVLVTDRGNQRVRRLDAGVLTTVAGTGSAAFAGDGGPATAARLATPNDVSATADGFVVADSGNRRVRSVASGTITTVAGRSPSGHGDGGLASAAQLDAPGRVAVAADGSVYVSDADAARVRRVSAAGIITTYAGTGVAGYSGDGAAATAAQLGRPAGLAVGTDGTLYIADPAANVVRAVTPGGTISTVPAGALDRPSGVAVDTAGNLYIADTTNHRVRKVDTGGAVTTVAGTATAGFGGDGGAATAALLNRPADVHVGADGSLYVADAGNDRVRRVAVGGTISTVAGDGTASPDGGISVGDGGAATAAQLFGPQAVTSDPLGNVFIADAGYDRVRRVDTAGTITSIAGTGVSGFNGDGTAATATLSFPSGIARDGLGNLFVADSVSRRVRRVAGYGTATTPPTVSFTLSPSAGTVPLAVGVDATASADPDGAIARYDWDFGDGATAAGVTAAHTYTTAGAYQVTLAVTDDQGAMATLQQQVTVSPAPNEPPVAAFTATPATGTAPLHVALDGTASDDADGTIVSYAWDFGDGSPTVASATVSHTYAAGAYTATLTVTDDDGATDTATQTVTATPPAPTDTVTVSLTDSQSGPYTNGGALSGGDIAVYSDRNGLVSVLGAATLPGLNGGDATVWLSIRRWFPGFLVGTIRVVDPGRGVNSSTLAFGGVTADGAHGAKGAHNWFGIANGRFFGYRLIWNAQDGT